MPSDTLRRRKSSDGCVMSPSTSLTSVRASGAELRRWESEATRSETLVRITLPLGRGTEGEREPTASGSKCCRNVERAGSVNAGGVDERARSDGNEYGSSNLGVSGTGER